MSEIDFVESYGCHVEEYIKTPDSTDRGPYSTCIML